jgi:hypothetical protein
VRKLGRYSSPLKHTRFIDSKTEHVTRFLGRFCKIKEFTRLPYTGLVLELEHLKIETRLISERFANAMGECEN